MASMNARSFNLEPGDNVGGYTLISRLGSGAMGSVWRVEDGGGSQYAMKILLDSLVDDDVQSEEERHSLLTARERLRREAMALRKIDNPGVCSIVDMEFDDSFAFIVTELIEGNNLREDVRLNGRYMGDDLERLAEKLMQAVQAVHRAGIVHRDIKPTNVMISNTGPVLVDFGIAMEEGDNHVTRTGLVMGTPGFIAPEIIQGAESDEMTDWWSVASVLAFAGTGAPVFGTQPMMAVLEREAAGNPNLQGLPPRSMQAFREALDPDRSRRCSPRELLGALQADAWGADGEVMLPFEASGLEAQAGGQGPRSLWSDDGARKPGMARILRESESSSSVSPAGIPAFLAQDVDESPTIAFDTPADDPPTLIVPAESLATATSALPQTSVLEQALPSRTEQEDGTQVIGTAAQQAAPTAPAPQSFSQPTPVSGPSPAPVPQAGAGISDSRLARYAKKGVLPTLLLGVPFAVVALGLPLVALFVASVTLWLLVSLGLNVEAQARREERRAGVRKSSDGAVRALSFPWHLCKGVPLALPRIAVFVLSDVMIDAIAAAVGNFPVRHAWFDLPGVHLQMPLIDGFIASPGSMLLAAGLYVSWSAAIFAFPQAWARIGAAALAASADVADTAGRIDMQDAQPGGAQPHERPPRRRVMLALWAMLCAVCALALFALDGISWWPLELLP